jgi:geranylgeranyl reductase family protein
VSEAREYDVVIVGLGPAGASAAATAAVGGARVLAVDRKVSAGEPVQCAEFVPSLIDVDRGVLGEATRQPISAMQTFVEEAPAAHQPRFPGWMIDRAAFDGALVRMARRAGAVCRFGSVVRSISAAGVVLASGDRLRPRVLIGADGPRSIIGRSIGRVNRALVETRQITVPLLRPHAATDIFLSSTAVGGYAWMFPKRDVAHVGAGLAPPLRARLKSVVADLHRRLVAEGRTGKDVLATTGGAIPVGGMLDPVGCVGDTLVALAGDAAGLANPVSGAGIHAAVVSGRLAGAAAVRWLAGRADAGSDYRDELAECFGASLDRALARRSRLLATYHNGGQPRPSDLKRGWIAFDEYWNAA